MTPWGVSGEGTGGMAWAMGNTSTTGVSKTSETDIFFILS